MLFKHLFLISILLHAYNAERLKRKFFPSHYNLTIIPNFDNDNFTFHGHVDIKIRCNLSDCGNEIGLHIANLTIHRYSLVKYGTNESIKSNGGFGSTSDDILLFRFKEQLESNVDYKFIIKYSQKKLIQVEKKGFFRGTYYNETARSNENIYWTELQPIYARNVFPCFDEPDFKATFKLTVGRPQGFITVSNTALESSRMLSDGNLVYDSFKTTPKMSTYLLGFVISKYSYVEEKLMEPFSNFKIWTIKENLTQYNVVTENIGPLAEWFKNYLSTPLTPIKGMDMVVIDKLNGDSKDNWGLWTVNSEDMQNLGGLSFYEKSAKTNALVFVSTSLSNNWFGDLVTPKWWSDFWVTTGISTFLAHESMKTNTSDIWKIYYLFVFQNYLWAEGQDYFYPLHRDVKTNEEVLTAYRAENAARASIIIRMMKNIIGEEKFHESIKNLLTKNYYSNIDQNDLWNELPTTINTTSISTKEVMESWTSQSGHPLVTISVDYKAKKIRIKQEQFQKPEYMEEGLWKIPLKYQILNKETEVSTEKFIVLMSKNKSITEGFISTNSVLIGNLGVTGYFRVNYDQESWEKIVNLLKTNHVVVNVFNRAQLIDDAFTLAEVELENISLAKNVSSYLTKETDALPWLTFFRHMSDMVRENDYQVNSDLKAWIKGLVGDIFQNMENYMIDSAKNTIDSYMKQEVWKWACISGNDDCANKYREVLQKWRETASSKKSYNLDPNVLVGVTCMVQLNSIQDLYFVKSQFENYPGLENETEECLKYRNQTN